MIIIEDADITSVSVVCDHLGEHHIVIVKDKIGKICRKSLVQIKIDWRLMCTTTRREMFFPCCRI